MKIPNLAIAFFWALLLQGCATAIYIPPATSQMSKSQLIHVSRIYDPVEARYIDKINSVRVAEPIFGSIKQYDFFVVPGAYSIEFSTGDDTTVEISPAQVGRTISDADFLKYGK